MYVLSNDSLTAFISRSGAELCSLRDNDGYEYIWTAEDVWKRHAPVLFPFVCNTLSKKYTVNGRGYALSNHGFARDSVFELRSYDGTSVELVLTSSENTLAVYPYSFELTVRYTLDGTGIKCTFITKNTGSEEMPFFIGGHPGFLCPFDSDKDGSFTDYKVVYEKSETIVQHLPDGDVTVLDGGTEVPLTRELFTNDVFMADKPASSEISLVDTKSGRSVSVRFDKRGCIAVWSPYDDRAGFVCLEPWAQTPVYDCTTEELTEMPHAQRLAPGAEHIFSFDIAVGTGGR
ncbi:MAG: aldose 1-epimerase family protein [Oscillospiraceae bacterium]|nr:aldose 1-epimerase family protein [Oscillospiraceae bacterium]